MNLFRTHLDRYCSNDAMLYSAVCQFFAELSIRPPRITVAVIITARVSKLTYARLSKLQQKYVYREIVVAIFSH